MKKSFLFFLLISMSLGFTTAWSIHGIKNSDTNKNNVYFFQIKIDDKNIDKVLKNIPFYIKTKEDKKVNYYIALTSKKQNVEKIQKIFKEKNIDTSVKNMCINNEEFIFQLKQYDILLKDVEEDEEILNIMEAIIDDYKQILSNT